MIEFSVYFSFLIYSKEKKKENHFSTKVHVIIKINATKLKPGFFFWCASYYEEKINYSMPKKSVYFSFNFGWSSSQVDIVR